VTITVGLNLCDEHAIPENVDFADAAFWERITVELRKLGKADPDPATSRIKFEPLRKSSFLA
jgi:hypothetical protein